MDKAKAAAIKEAFNNQFTFYKGGLGGFLAISHILKDQMSGLLRTSVSPDDDIALKDMIVNNGVGGYKAINLYKHKCQIALYHAGIETNPWPANWMEYTLVELAIVLAA